MMPLAKARLAKESLGRDEEGWEKLGRALETRLAERAQLAASLQQSQTLEVWAGACSWSVDFSLSLGSSSFSLHFLHSPNVRSTKPTVNTVSPSCCILSFGFLWKNYNIYPHFRFYLLERLNVKRWLFIDCSVGHCSSYCLDYFWAQRRPQIDHKYSLLH